MPVSVRPRAYVPGLAVLVAGGIVAYATAAVLPRANPLVLAVAIGVVVGNGVGVPPSIEPGLRQRKLLLEAGSCSSPSDPGSHC